MIKLRKSQKILLFSQRCLPKSVTVEQAATEVVVLQSALSHFAMHLS